MNWPPPIHRLSYEWLMLSPCMGRDETSRDKLRGMSGWTGREFWGFLLALGYGLCFVLYEISILYSMGCCWNKFPVFAWTEKVTSLEFALRPLTVYVCGRVFSLYVSLWIFFFLPLAFLIFLFSSCLSFSPLLSFSLSLTICLLPCLTLSVSLLLLFPPSGQTLTFLSIKA